MLFRGLFLYLPYYLIYWYGSLIVKENALIVMELQELDRTQIFTDNIELRGFAPNLKILLICVYLCPIKKIKTLNEKR